MPICPKDSLQHQLFFSAPLIPAHPHKCHSLARNAVLLRLVNLRVKLLRLLPIQSLERSVNL